MRMGIHVPETTAMVVSMELAPAAVFSCNGNAVEQLATFK